MCWSFAVVGLEWYPYCRLGNLNFLEPAGNLEPVMGLIYFFYFNQSFTVKTVVALNSLNTELNPICHLLALLGAHHILHVSRVRVNLGLEA